MTGCSTVNGKTSCYDYSGSGVSNVGAVESMFNNELQKYCDGASGCKISAKVFEVLSNGTLLALSG
jgi:hypothetical protein